MKKLFKKDALFILDNKEKDEDYFHIWITSIKSKEENYFGAWFEFQPELDELEIIGSDYEGWWCERKNIDRDQLKKELEDKGFKVIFGEDEHD